MIEIELAKAADALVVGLYMDKSGQHVLAAIQTSGVSELHYLHAKWKKPRLLNKLKGVHITALAWHPTDVSDASTG